MVLLCLRGGFAVFSVLVAAYWEEIFRLFAGGITLFGATSLIDSILFVDVMRF